MNGLACEDGKCRVLCYNKDDCGSNEHCENNRCVINLVDTCKEGFGGEDGKDCSNCLPGHWGDQCKPCTCEHGECWDGKSGNGLCRGECQDGWDGPKCDRCADGYATDNCILPSCKNGTANLEIDGDGHCSDCNSDWSGPDCTIRPACNTENGEPNYGVNGNGKCLKCNDNWTGDDCNTCPAGYYNENNNCVDCSKDSPSFGKPKCTYTDTRNNSSTVYKVVMIGDQIWMAENMRYKTGTYHSINDSDTNDSTYGLLYNWQTAQTVCPEGWHLPSGSNVNDETTQDYDFNKLLNYAESNKTSDTLFLSLIAQSATWSEYQNQGGDDFGFAILPAGAYYGSYDSFGKRARIWSSTTTPDDEAYAMGITGEGSSDAKINIGGNSKTFGFSVRCIKD